MLQALAMTTSMSSVALFLFLVLAVSSTDVSSIIGVNYGRQGNNLPSPYQTIQTLQSMNIDHVKIYDADPEILKLLAGTRIHVTIMVANQDIINIASNRSAANQWIHENVLAYYPDTMIRFILVGNEVLSHRSPKDRKIWHNIVPAMQSLKASLKAQDIRNIKIGTPVAMDVLQTTFPPSEAKFRPDIASTVITPLLKFLNGSKSFFFVDVYPYFPWSSDPYNISLNFALFTSNQTYKDPHSGLVYTNLLDQMLDSLIFAMTKLGYPSIKIFIAETGWPNAGDIDQTGANIHNAATYNRYLITRLTATPPIGTPARPFVDIPTFVFSLYNENQKEGPGTERHWGLLHSNGTSTYEIDFTGSRKAYKPLPAAHNNMPYRGKLWCVVAEGANLNQLMGELTYACSRGNDTCSALTPGKECYEPISVTSHANYAFSSYWAKFKSEGATCYFNGLAQQTTKNPSHGECEIPAIVI